MMTLFWTKSTWPTFKLSIWVWYPSKKRTSNSKKI